MKKIDYAIGIVGGMGSYATLDFFRRVLQAFPAEKEWDRPRVIIDNYCTMPSRVRAVLYNERRDELVADLSNSMGKLLEMGVTRIILACNTSHIFLPEIMKLVPDAEKAVLNIIDLCGREIKLNGMDSIDLIASEGTILSGIYNETFKRHGIEVNSPSEDQFAELRGFIEAVKQDKMDDGVLKAFASYVNSFQHEAVILGCTELPIIYRKALEHKYSFSKGIFDPLQASLDFLKDEYNSL